jgi:hypothetical protein
MFEMFGNGTGADRHRVSDRAVRPSHRDRPQNLQFAQGQQFRGSFRPGSPATPVILRSLARINVSRSGPRRIVRIHRL